MDVNFTSTDAEAVEPIIFEKIWGEKPGGGVVPNPAYDLPIGSAVGLNGAVRAPIKAYRLLKAVAIIDTTIDIAKGSGIVSGDIIGNGVVAVASTAVDTTTYTTKDVVTVTMGIVIANGTVLYQAAGASADASVPKYTPLYLLGAPVIAGLGDQIVKLVNGATVRKETVNASLEVLALMKGILIV